MLRVFGKIPVSASADPADTARVLATALTGLKTSMKTDARGVRCFSTITLPEGRMMDTLVSTHNGLPGDFAIPSNSDPEWLQLYKQFQRESVDRM